MGAYYSSEQDAEKIPTVNDKSEEIEKVDILSFGPTELKEQMKKLKKAKQVANVPSIHPELVELRFVQENLGNLETCQLQLYRIKKSLNKGEHCGRSECECERKHVEGVHQYFRDYYVALKESQNSSIPAWAYFQLKFKDYPHYSL
jgi:hypothetical protein